MKLLLSCPQAQRFAATGKQIYILFSSDQPAAQPPEADLQEWVRIRMTAAAGVIYHLCVKDHQDASLEIASERLDHL